MTQQISTFATGELSASIEGHGEFNAQNVEFMGSTNDPDFLLRGMDASRGLIFYFPRFESGHHELSADSASKAFYEVDGALNGEVKEGFVDVTVEAEDAVSVSFDFSIEDKAEAALIRIKGSGNFKGRVPWTDNGRALSNVICGVNGARSDDLTMSLKPCAILLPAANTIIAPFEWFSGKGHPGAQLNLWRKEYSNVYIHYGSTSVDGNGDWKIPPNRVLPVKPVQMQAMQGFNGASSASEIVEYTVDPVGPLVITMPKEGESLYYKGYLRGTGVAGARVTLHQHNDPYTVYGVANVRDDKTWFAPLDRELPLGPFAMTAKQTLGGVSSGWAHSVNFQAVSFPPPTIKIPAQGEQFRYDRHVSGEGVPHAILLLYKQNDFGTLYGLTKVNEDGGWSTPLAENVPAGPFSLSAVQTLTGGVDSDFSTIVNFTIIR